MNVSYEIRTSRNVPAMSFDSLDSAQKKLADVRKRLGADWRIVKITRTEQEIAS